MKNTKRLAAGMATLGIAPAATPDVNVATFVCKSSPQPWKVSWTRNGDLRIVCMPHVHRDTIEAFLKDFSDMHA